MTYEFQYFIKTINDKVQSNIEAQYNDLINSYSNIAALKTTISLNLETIYNDNWKCTYPGNCLSELQRENIRKVILENLNKFMEKKEFHDFILEIKQNLPSDISQFISSNNSISEGANNLDTIYLKLETKYNDKWKRTHPTNCLLAQQKEDIKLVILEYLNKYG
jgi:hypothetical protein